MTVPKQRTILVWRNGNWSHMYHDKFFVNMVREETKKVSTVLRQKKERELHAGLLTGQVSVGGYTFRYKFEKEQATQ